jgi:hypothetical protein
MKRTSMRGWFVVLTQIADHGRELVGLTRELVTLERERAEFERERGQYERERAEFERERGQYERERGKHGIRDYNREQIEREQENARTRAIMQADRERARERR